MRKVIRLLAVTAISLSLLISMVAADTKATIPAPDDYDIIQYGTSYFKNPTAKNLEELEQYSQLVIKGKTIENVNQIIFGTFTGYTITSVEVLEVLKGDTLTEGDRFDLMENYTIVAYDGQNVLSSFDGYMPSELNTEYIFFLMPVPSMENTYCMHNSIMGRYPIPAAEKSVENATTQQKTSIKLVPEKLEKLPLNEKAAIKLYEPIYQEVFDTYIINSNIINN